jgi:carbonic anhydrase/acetyltransferase-like protein (isoleucine patch superfamily)
MDIDGAPDPADDARRAAGFLTVAEVLGLLPEVRVLDPSSVLIGTDVTLAAGAVLYPGTVLETRAGGSITVGSGVRLGPGCVTVVATTARVTIGCGAELGPGPVTITATGSDVRVGDGARLSGGCLVEGPAVLGAGAQVLGAVAVRDAVLAAGGDHREADPDRRAGVVKGIGRVHGARVGVGEVVVGGGVPSAPLVVERQRAHHPEAPSR